MNNVNQTLYIPLYGKAFVSRRGILLHDPSAEAIWQAEGFPLKGKSRSKWLAFYMGMRSAVFDRWLRERMREDPGAVVLHLGCGLDSRILRVGAENHLWLDVDFPDVIRERQRFFKESGNYRMIPSDIRDPEWLEALPRDSRVILVMEGISMYLPPEELETLLRRIHARCSQVRILMDCYSEFAAKASRFRNPINDVGVTKVWGMDDPRIAERWGYRFLKEHDMTPEDLIGQLHGSERRIFRWLYAGKLAQGMYRLYEYTSL